MKFSKQEINLCKQIAKKHESAIVYGDWYLYGNEIQIHLWAISYPMAKEDRNKPRAIFLWTLEDCLEFLRGKECWLYQLKQEQKGYEITILQLIPKKKARCTHESITITKKGKTPLEACLKAVLAVLEEK